MFLVSDKEERDLWLMSLQAVLVSNASGTNDQNSHLSAKENAVKESNAMNPNKKLHVSFGSMDISNKPPLDPHSKGPQGLFAELKLKASSLHKVN